MRQLVAVVIMLACPIYSWLRFCTHPCGHRDEACAWSCRRPRGHAGEHGLWLKDERADAMGLLR